jgi:hypothetical protein
MKNLLERMKAEPLAKFNEAKKEYFNTYNDIERELESNYFVINLKFGTIITLCDGLSVEHPFKIYDIFND